jgi:hypothetical protein
MENCWMFRLGIIGREGIKDDQKNKNKNIDNTQIQACSSFATRNRDTVLQIHQQSNVLSQTRYYSAAQSVTR